MSSAAVIISQVLGSESGVNRLSETGSRAPVSSVVPEKMESENVYNYHDLNDVYHEKL